MELDDLDFDELFGEYIPVEAEHSRNNHVSWFFRPPPNLQNLHHPNYLSLSHRIHQHSQSFKRSFEHSGLIVQFLIVMLSGCLQSATCAQIFYLEICCQFSEIQVEHCDKYHCLSIKCNHSVRNKFGDCWNSLGCRFSSTVLGFQRIEKMVFITLHFPKNEQR